MKNSKSKSKPKLKSNKTIKRKKTSKTDLKKLKYNLTPKQKLTIKNNKIVSSQNIGKIKQEILFDSGIFLINLKDELYSLRSPTIIGRLGLYDKIFDMFEVVLSELIIVLNKEYKDIIYRIAKTKFNRYLNYTDYNNDVIVDIIFLMKIIKYLLNENHILEFNKIKKKTKIINIFNELIEVRNFIAHHVFKQDEYKTQPTLNKYYNQTRKKLNTRQKNQQNLYKKIKNNMRHNRYLNYLHYLIDNIIYIIQEFNQLNININKRLFNNQIVNLTNLKSISTNICIEKLRHKQLSKKLTTEKQVQDLAQETLDYLQLKLNNPKTNKKTARNVVNMITTILIDDKIITKYITKEKSKTKLKKKCHKYEIM